MRGRFCCFVIILQMVSWALVTSGPIAANDGLGVPHHLPEGDQSSQSLQVTLSSEKGGAISMVRGREMNEAPSSVYKGGSKVGSSPPSCEHKCYGCSPCEAIQVPTTTSHFGIQYTNYEPEGWKCKCGPSFYSP